MKNMIGLAAALVAVVVGGCREQVYTLDLKPVANGLERTLDWRLDQTTGTRPPASSPRSPGRIAAAYGADAPDADAVAATFAGVFSERMPADVGGAGSYREFRSVLGTTRVYLERFRGEPDLLAQIEKQNAGVDAAVDVIIGWLEPRVQGEEGAERLLAWAGTDLRRDWKNLSLYNWLGQEQITGMEELASGAGNFEDGALRAFGTMGARAAQLLIERGYMTLTEACAMMASLDGDGPVRGTEYVLPLLRRQIATRLGQADLPAALAADLATMEALEASFLGYIAGSEAAQKRLQAWAAERLGEEVAAGAVADGSLFEAVVYSAFPIPLLRSYDELTVRLAAAHEPIATNGRWDAATQTVTWSARLETSLREAAGQPTLAFAAWAEADAAAQKMLLGGELLRGRDLALYCVWLAGLSEGQAREWEAALSTMEPGPELSRRLRAFRFQAREEDDEPVGGAAIIIDRLNAGK